MKASLYYRLLEYIVITGTLIAVVLRRIDTADFVAWMFAGHLIHHIGQAKEQEEQPR